MQVVWKGTAASEDAKQEATEVDALWTLLGLAASDGIIKIEEGKTPVTTGRARALGWIKSRAPRHRNDWLAWRMLVEQCHGEVGATAFGVIPNGACTTFVCWENWGRRFPCKHSTSTMQSTRTLQCNYAILLDIREGVE